MYGPVHSASSTLPQLLGLASQTSSLELSDALEEVIFVDRDPRVERIHEGAVEELVGVG